MGKRRRFEYEDDEAKDETLWLEKSDKEAALFNPVADATSPLTKLHDEILAFCALVAPSAGETRRRDAAVANIEAAVAGVWPKATVHVFGSSLTGSLSPLPASTSSSGASGPRRLRALAAELTKRDAATNMEVVESARIPIVKYADRATGIPSASRPQLLALENPDDASLDVGKNSFAMTRVKRAFERARSCRSRAAATTAGACLLGSAVDATVLNPRVASSEDTT
ncbi:polynucleotide adenylyltransferase [Aureococcus anophagefferens]|uniref:Polynucleotide adenylyltransferase n=1 Tax=Aureococcus anophagefferens TaxID=44056 RepID=A0ABR1FGR6_AURAN